MPPLPTDIPTGWQGLIATIVAAFVGARVIITWVSSRDSMRDAAIEAKVSAKFAADIARFTDDIARLNARIDKFETGREQAIGHLMTALEIAASIPRTADLRRELRNAAEALK